LLQLIPGKIDEERLQRTILSLVADL